jgi:orotate phosphoribosyltransferase
MELHKQHAIELLVRKRALEFGDFILKSGRKSPYFLDIGRLDDGESLLRLGHSFACEIVSSVGVDSFDILLGPAYKGIPLALSTAISLSKDFGVNKRFVFDRKTEKTHAEGGRFVGTEFNDGDHILILDDVITTGGTKYDLMRLVSKSAQVDFRGVLVGLDRQECSDTGKGTAQDFTERTGIKVFSILTMSEVIEFLSITPVDGEIYITDSIKQEIDRYRSRYGVPQSGTE